MKYLLKENAQLIEMLGIVSIVGSLIFVGIEMQQAQQISFAEQDLSRAEINIALRNEINENIDIWTNGNSGQELDEKSAKIYESMVQNSWERADALAEARLRLGSDANVAIHQFSVFLSENPGAQIYWAKMMEKEQSARQVLQYNTTGFNVRRELVLSDLEKLDQQSN